MCLSAKKVGSAAEGISPAAITIKTLKSMSADDKFALFCKDVHNLVNAPVLPLRRVCRNDMKMETPSPDTDTFRLALKPLTCGNCL